MNAETVVLGARDVARYLTIRECIDAIAETLRAHEAGKSRGPASSGFTLPGGSFHAKLAAIEDDGRIFVAVKANVNLPGNPIRHGRPTIQGVLILLDGDDGRPLAIMDSIALTSLRTAAVAALAAEHLALSDSRTITIVGCGEQGEAQLCAMAAVRPLRAGFAVDVDSAKATALAARLSIQLGWRLEASTNLAAAVAASDICVTCTTAESPLLFAEHLHPGLFVAAVGADNPAKQEIDATALSRSRVVVDSLAACAAGGDLHHAIRANAMTEQDVHGELSAIVAGRVPARSSRDQVFVFDSTGTALQDAAAAVCCRRCRPAPGAGRQTCRGGDDPGAMKDLVWYFFKLGSFGFGGPAALVGYMRRDLVEDRRLIDESTYNLSIALAQIMPGPLAAQTAMAIGYFQSGVVGATLVGLAFILPSFLMVVGLSALYVAYGGMPWMQSVFYGIGALIIAIIAVAAYRLARGTNKRDPLLWTIFVVMLVATAWTGTELATLFLLAGLLVLLVRAWPGAWPAVALSVAGVAAAALIVALERALSTSTASGDQHVLLQILLFFTKAGSFVFGSGLAIVPFLQQGVVHDMAWLTEHQFLDAVAVALITPGPVVITVAFIGYLVAGVAGATVAAVGIFLPVYFFTIVPAPWFRRHRDNLQLRAFAAGATTAASGAIAGAVLVLGRGAISDLLTACIALTGLVLLVRFRVPEPLLVLGAGLAGLALSRQ